MLQVRDAVREVFRTQLSDAPDETIVEARRHLNRTYDFFVSRFGPLNARENVKAFADDPDQPLLLSLEEFDPETKRATKTAIFDRRTLERYRPVERVETASEALLVSLNETGQINWPRMESLTGQSCIRVAGRTWISRLPKSRGRSMGDCRPLSQRQRARETCRRAGFSANRSGLSPECGSAAGCAAERPGTGRNRSAPRLIVDSPFRHPRLRCRVAGCAAAQA